MTDTDWLWTQEGQAPLGAGRSSPARQQVAAAATQEYTYDKAIEDYVKFSNAALSKSDALARYLIHDTNPLIRWY